MGSSSEDDWEKEYDREKELERKQQVAAVAPPVSAPSPSSRTSSNNALPSKRSDQNAAPIKYNLPKTHLKIVANDTPLDDPIAERLRRKQLEEMAEGQLFQDLLEGAPQAAQEVLLEAVKKGTTGSTERTSPSSVKKGVQGSAASPEFEFQTINDCTKFVQTFTPQIEKSSAKSVVWMALLASLIEVVGPKMDEKDLKTISNKLVKQATKQVADRHLAAQKKKKVNDDKKNQVVNARDEYDLFYGKREVDSFDEDEGGEDADNEGEDSFM